MTQAAHRVKDAVGTAFMPLVLDAMG
jgi:hypothetical protein